MEAEELIVDSYARVKELIAENPGLVEQIVSALIARQEMSGEELRKMVGECLREADQLTGISIVCNGCQNV
jgi:ATP-dependent Zn protease